MKMNYNSENILCNDIITLHRPNYSPKTKKGDFYTPANCTETQKKAKDHVIKREKV